MATQQQINQIIQAIADANDGQVTPRMVYEHARDLDSPLHDEYEWDLEKAATRTVIWPTRSPRHLVPSMQ